MTGAQRIYQRNWQRDNRDKVKGYHAVYASKNADKLKGASHKWYIANKDKMKASQRAYMKERGGLIVLTDFQLRKKEYVIKYLEQHSCVDCGNTDIRVLEFDHTKGPKYKCVSVLVWQAYSIEVLDAEIAKCEVRCANCHKIRHCEDRRDKFYALRA